MVAFPWILHSVFKKNSRGGPRWLTLWTRSPDVAMPTKAHPRLPAPVRSDEAFAQVCVRAKTLPRSQLLAVALARGCRHYAPLWPELVPANLTWLPQEALGCALLRGPETASTFQAIRCGAMILSDLGNEPGRIAQAAKIFDVAERVAHLARLGQVDDDFPEYWTGVLAALPDLPAAGEDFLPRVSRLVAETWRSGPGQGAKRVWLRPVVRQ